MTLEKVALDDELLIQYLCFKNNENCDLDLIDKLISHLKMPFVKDKSQIKRCREILQSQYGDELYADKIIPKQMILPLLSINKPETAEKDLAKDSVYKVILTSNKNKKEFPYVNISNPKLELSYSRTCKKDMSRNDLIKHLKELCLNATKIIIYDKYFLGGDNITANEKLFEKVFPKNKLKIQIVCQDLQNNMQHKLMAGKLKEICPAWEYVQGNNESYSIEDNHDRYLLIKTGNKSLQVMLSSGFLYLWNNRKEITCVFQEVE